MNEITTTDIYREDIEVIDEFKSIKQEPRRDSLHRLIMAGKSAIEEARNH